MYWWERYGKRTTTAAPKKKLFLYVRDQQIFTRCCFFFPSLAGLLFFLPLTNCDFFLLQSQKISPNQFADLFIENLALFRCRLTHTHTHVRGRNSSTENTHREKHDPDPVTWNSSYKGSQTRSPTHRYQIVAGRSVGCTLPRALIRFFAAVKQLDCKKWWRHGGG